MFWYVLKVLNRVIVLFCCSIPLKYSLLSNKSVYFSLFSWRLSRMNRESVFLAAWFTRALRWPYSLARLNLNRKWPDSADQPLDSPDPVLRGVLNWRVPHMQTNNTDEQKQSWPGQERIIVVLGQRRWSHQHLHILYTRMHAAIYLILKWNSCCASSLWP